MTDLIVWAAIGGVAALATQRKALAVLIGVLVAILGTMIQAGVLVAALAAAMGAGTAGGGQSATPILPVVRGIAVAVFIACGVGVLVLAHLITGGSVGSRRR